MHHLTAQGQMPAASARPQATAGSLCGRHHGWTSRMIPSRTASEHSHALRTHSSVRTRRSDHPSPTTRSVKYPPRSANPRSANPARPAGPGVAGRLPGLPSATPPPSRTAAHGGCWRPCTHRPCAPSAIRTGASAAARPRSASGYPVRTGNPTASSRTPATSSRKTKQPSSRMSSTPSYTSQADAITTQLVLRRHASAAPLRVAPDSLAELMGVGGQGVEQASE
jgi:hypothetical protein